MISPTFHIKGASPELVAAGHKLTAAIQAHVDASLAKYSAEEEYEARCPRVTLCFPDGQSRTAIVMMATDTEVVVREGRPMAPMSYVRQPDGRWLRVQGAGGSLGLLHRSGFPFDPKHAPVGAASIVFDRGWGPPDASPELQAAMAVQYAQAELARATEAVALARLAEDNARDALERVSRQGSSK